MKEAKQWFVYLLECADGSLYTGYTNDLEKRFKKHQEGKGAKYTRSHKAVRISYSEQVKTKILAMKREREIKSWKKEEKEHLIQTHRMPG